MSINKLIEDDVDFVKNDGFSGYNLVNLLEAILFTAGSGVTIDELQERMPEYDSPTIMNAIRSLKSKYSGACGIVLINYENKLQFTSNSTYADKVSSVLLKGRERELSESLLETLAIVAYNQPITRSRVHNIRGKNPDYSIAKLAELRLIDVVGRTDNNGVLFGTTEEFLKRFQLSTMYDLPKRSDLLVRLKVMEENFQLSGKDLFIDKTQGFGDNADPDAIQSIIDEALSKAGICEE